MARGVSRTKNTLLAGKFCMDAPLREPGSTFSMPAIVAGCLPQEPLPAIRWKPMTSRSNSDFFRSLSRKPGLHTFNPWTDQDPSTDALRTAPTDRLERLRAHLSISARYILIGEAAGYQGCK